MNGQFFTNDPSLGITVEKIARRTDGRTVKVHRMGEIKYWLRAMVSGMRFCEIL